MPKKAKPLLSYPRTLLRGPRGWYVDPKALALRGIRGKRRREGIEQAGKLAAAVNFLETNLKIVTKNAKLREFKLNVVQQIVVQLIAFCWAQLRPAQILVPKSRQMGVSTLLQGLLFVLAFLSDNFRCLTVAHREDSASMIFRMSHTFEQWLPESYKRTLKTHTKGCMEWKDSGSMTQVATIGSGDGLGMGYTLNALHGSEVAVWAKKGDAKAAWTSVAPAIASNRDTLIAFESTPDGPDPFFHDLCVKALHGFGDWETVFLGWYLDPTYQITKQDYALRVKRARLQGVVDFTLTPEEQELVELVRSQPTTVGEEWIRWPVKLSLEQLLWRRLTIENQCSGDVEQFNRYYPSTFEMAFATRDVALFEAHTMDRMGMAADTPYKVGAYHLKKGRPYFEPMDVPEAKHAKWKVLVWEGYDPEFDYVIGSDCSEGIEGDFSCSYVGKLDPATGQIQVVASVYGQIDPDLYAEQLDLVGQAYGEALLAVETNRVFEVVRKLRQRGYPNLYWRRDPSSPKSRARNPGWSTDKKTRPVMLAIFRAMSRDNDVVCPDGELVKEMRTMIPGAGGKWQARKGKHDDRIMAISILLAVAGFRDNRGRRQRVDRQPAMAPERKADGVSVMTRNRAYALARRGKKGGTKTVAL